MDAVLPSLPGCGPLTFVENPIHVQNSAPHARSRLATSQSCFAERGRERERLACRLLLQSTRPFHLKRWAKRAVSPRVTAAQFLPCPHTSRICRLVCIRPEGTAPQEASTAPLPLSLSLFPPWDWLLGMRNKVSTLDFVLPVPLTHAGSKEKMKRVHIVDQSGEKLACFENS